MEIPELVRRTLGDEGVEAAVNLGDEDLVCFTPTRMILYRGEGLLSDEKVDVYDHDVERLDVTKGRRKTSFKLQYVDSSDSFSVSNGRGEPVLERLLTGVLGTTGVIDHAETVEGVFQYSELTLVVTAQRLLKHVGAHVWDEEYQEYAYESVTGLEFEDGSVATQIVLSVDSRPQRIKVPSDDVGVLRQTLEGALFAYHDVSSLQQLNEAVGISPDSAERTETATRDNSQGISLDDTISPLVGDDDGKRSQEQTQTSSDAGKQPSAGQASTDVDTVRSATASTEGAASEKTTTGEPPVDDAPAQQRSTSEQTTGQSVTDDTSQSQTTSQSDAVVSRAEIDEMRSEIEALRTAVERQSKLLKDQQETIDTLIEELRRRH